MGDPIVSPVLIIEIVHSLPQLHSSYKGPYQNTTYIAVSAMITSPRHPLWEKLFRKKPFRKIPPRNRISVWVSVRLWFKSKSPLESIVWVALVCFVLKVFLCRMIIDLEKLNKILFVLYCLPILMIIYF